MRSQNAVFVVMKESKNFPFRMKEWMLRSALPVDLQMQERLWSSVKNGEAEYHLIEIMACRRGCIMGGGQPVRAR